MFNHLQNCIGRNKHRTITKKHTEHVLLNSAICEIKNVYNLKIVT